MDSFLASFDLSLLTLIKFEDWRVLPERAGIYFVFGADGAVLYIGQTQNLLDRWGLQYRRLHHSDAARIGFFLTKRSRVWRQFLERALIKTHKPRLHGIPKVLGPKLGCKYGERERLRKAAALR